MGVDVTGKGKKRSGILTCDTCGTKSKSYSVQSAAPELEACEQANEKDGWGYTVGFFAMMMGHTVYCPKCAHPKKEGD